VTPADDPWRGALSRVPAPARVTLLCFLAIVGFGYLVAVANLYTSHAMADGEPGLSLRDLRVMFSGSSEAEDGSGVMPSRMLTMIHGAMRQYVESDEEFGILESWLKAGGRIEAMHEGVDGKSPAEVIMTNCLRCHAQSSRTEISRHSPFGQDEFEVDAAMVSRFTGGGAASRSTPQYTLPRLILVSHIHMLSIPMFTLAVGLMFMMSGGPARFRAIVGPLPMAALAVDFAGWWLARLHEAFIYALVGAGAVFGVALGVQIVCAAAVLVGRSGGERQPN
jgi:hypothetical protein